MILLGFFAWQVSIPLIIMLVVIITTKPTVLTNEGFWEMLHGSRTAWSMLLGSFILLIKGGGYSSIDHKLY